VLALKLLLVPAFLALLTLAARWLGPAVAGWLAGLPLVAGPILVVLALENGGAFAAEAATATVTAVLASVCFCAAYAHAAQRHAWPLALALGLAAWTVAALALGLLAPDLVAGLAVALLSLWLAPRLFPKTLPGTSRPLAPVELLIRMAAGAALTVAVSAVAARIGGTWSGLFALFPVLGSVLAVFSHRSNGAGFVAVLLQGLARGLYSLVAFCATAAWLLPTQPLGRAFAAATLACAAVQLATRRRAAQPRGS
jgi:hypothetical protein